MADIILEGKNSAINEVAKMVSEKPESSEDEEESVEN